MKLFRIYTERFDDERDNQTLDLVSEVFEGFTVFETWGYWEGKSEKSLVIEIVEHSFNGKTRVDVDLLANKIARTNGQDCCMVTESECVARMISGA